MDISEITDFLLVGAQPCVEDAHEIAGRNVRLVITMMAEWRPPKIFGEPPLNSLWVRAYDTFFTPIAVDKLMQGVESSLQVIQNGGRVFVHCHKGRHRSVIMAAAILIASGYTAEQAIALLRAQRRVADPTTWYVRRQIHRFEKHWHKQSRRSSKID